MGNYRCNSSIDDAVSIVCAIMYHSFLHLLRFVFRPSISFKDRSSKKAYAISDRMPIDEIQGLIEDGNHLTFDYLALMTIASLIAGAGLVGDNVVFVIASMLVSPLMGPILSMTFGFAITNYDVVYRGFRNEIWGVFISMFTGFTLGVCSTFVYNPEFHSHEMVII